MSDMRHSMEFQMEQFKIQQHEIMEVLQPDNVLGLSKKIQQLFEETSEQKVKMAGMEEMKEKVEDLQRQINELRKQEKNGSRYLDNRSLKDKDSSFSDGLSGSLSSLTSDLQEDPSLQQSLMQDSPQNNVQLLYYGMAKKMDQLSPAECLNGNIDFAIM